MRNAELFREVESSLRNAVAADPPTHPRCTPVRKLQERLA
jgi:hypothetical protein